MHSFKRKYVDLSDREQRQNNVFYRWAGDLLGGKLVSINVRLVILKAGLHGSITFKELLLYFLPSRLKLNFNRSNLRKTLNDEARNNLRHFIKEEGGLYPFFGHKLFIPDDNFHEIYELLTQVVGSDQYHARDFIKENSVIIDAGANIGVFSVLAANIARSGKVYAFEPVKKAYDLLNKNVDAYKNVVTVNVGLGSAVSKKKIATNDFSLISSTMEDSDSLQIGDGWNNSAEIVEVTTIDKFVEENNLLNVDFIKIDTEGYESKIIEGAKNTINRFSPTIVMSAYHHKEDKIMLPKIVKNINKDYQISLSHRWEDDFVCLAKNRQKK